MSFRVLSHTADTGIEASAPGLGELIEQLAVGMFSIMADLKAHSLDHEAAFTIEAETPGDLVVEALSELVYRSEADDVLFADFTVELQGEWRVTVTASGFGAGGVELVGAPIKAVTYHDLEVRSTNGMWFGRVFFDV